MPFNKYFGLWRSGAEGRSSMKDGASSHRCGHRRRPVSRGRCWDVAITLRTCRGTYISKKALEIYALDVMQKTAASQSSRQEQLEWGTVVPAPGWALARAKAWNLCVTAQLPRGDFSPCTVRDPFSRRQFRETLSGSRQPVNSTATLTSSTLTTSSCVSDT